MTPRRRTRLAVSAALAAGLSTAALAQQVQREAIGVLGGLMSDSTTRLHDAMGAPAGVMTAAGGSLVDGFAAIGYQPGTTVDLAGTSNSAGALTLSWSAPGVDGTVVNGVAGSMNGRYRVDYSSDSSHPFTFTSYQTELSTSGAAPGSAQFFGVSSLLGNATYFIELYSLDLSSAVSNPAVQAAALTQAYPPTALAVSTVSVSSTAVSLQWGQSNNSAATVFSVELATASGGSPITASPFAAALGYAFTGLTAGTTYFARVRARNSAGVATAYTSLGSVFLAAPNAVVPPAAPLGVTGSFPGGSVFNINWQPVTKDANGNPDTMAGYDVYKSTALSGTPAFWGFVAPSTSTLSFTDPSGAAFGNYYFVRSTDTAGHESADSAYVFSSPGASVTIAPPSKDVALLLPPGAASGASQSHVGITVSDRPGDVGGSILQSCEVDASDLTSGQPKPGYVFAALSQLVFNLQAGELQAVKQGLTDTDVAVFYNNGVEFVKLGGDVNPFAKTISIQVSKAGVYQVRASLRANQFTVMNTVPTKIFTPNGDGVNDTFDINYDNPASSPVTSGKVYDLQGHEVADLTNVPSGGTSGTMRWDGRDHGGSTARSGVYIWQIQAEGRTMNGTCVLAK